MLSPVWAGLPVYMYLNDLVESVQKESLRIIFPVLPYEEALVCSGLQTLSEGCVQACRHFMQAITIH